MSNELDEAKVPRVKPSPTLWCPPLSDSVKINVDAAVNQAMEYIGIGIVAWDCNGMLLVATTNCMFGRFSPRLGECLAVREGVWSAQSSWLLQLAGRN